MIAARISRSRQAVAGPARSSKVLSFLKTVGLAPTAHASKPCAALHPPSHALTARRDPHSRAAGSVAGQPFRWEDPAGLHPHCRPCQNGSAGRRLPGLDPRCALGLRRPAGSQTVLEHPPSDRPCRARLRMPWRTTIVPSRFPRMSCRPASTAEGDCIDALGRLHLSAPCWPRPLRSAVRPVIRGAGISARPASRLRDAAPDALRAQNRGSPVAPMDAAASVGSSAARRRSGPRATAPRARAGAGPAG